MFRCYSLRPCWSLSVRVPEKSGRESPSDNTPDSHRLHLLPYLPVPLQVLYSFLLHPMPSVSDSPQIGRASCRERLLISAVGSSFKNTNMAKVKRFRQSLACKTLRSCRVYNSCT